MAKAKSNYRQLRLTFTEEPSGRASWRVQVKALENSWSEFTTVARGESRASTHALSTEEALVYLMESVANHLSLPRL